MYTYADVYNELYASRERNACVRKLLAMSVRMCLPHRIRMVKHIRTALCSQSAFAALDASETMAQSALTHKMCVHRTRRLARSMLRHTYRPSGRMMRRLVAATPFTSK